MQRKTKNKILKTITWVAGFTFTMSACCLDGKSDTPVLICGACLAWLLLMYAANHDRL